MPSAGAAASGDLNDHIRVALLDQTADLPKNWDVHGGLVVLVARVDVEHRRSQLGAVVHLVCDLLRRARQAGVALLRVEVARERHGDHQLAVILGELGEGCHDGGGANLVELEESARPKLGRDSSPASSFVCICNSRYMY